MSVREYQLSIEGLIAARKRQVDDMVFLAHQAASLTAYAYHQPKKLPKLQALLNPRATSQGQTTDEQIAAFKSIMAARRKG